MAQYQNLKCYENSDQFICIFYRPQWPVNSNNVSNPPKQEPVVAAVAGASSEQPVDQVPFTIPPKQEPVVAAVAGVSSGQPGNQVPFIFPSFPQIPLPSVPTQQLNQQQQLPAQQAFQPIQQQLAQLFAPPHQPFNTLF